LVWTVNDRSTTIGVSWSSTRMVPKVRHYHKRIRAASAQLFLFVYILLGGTKGE
jgi:hypothetical protein